VSLIVTKGVATVGTAIRLPKRVCWIPKGLGI
jgi:hypothetical protein